MMDQVSKYNSRGLETEFIGAAQTSVEKRDRVMRGEIQLVFVTPETIIGNARFRNMLLNPTYREKLICVAVDEAHRVKLWGGVFRPQFAEIGVLRSIIPSASPARAFNIGYARARVVTDYRKESGLRD